MNPDPQFLEKIKELSTTNQREQVISLLPDEVLTKYNSHELYSASAHAHMETGDVGRAIRDFTRAINLSPNNDEYYNNRGTVYMHLKDYEEATRNFNKALEINPDKTIALFNRAEANKALTNYKEALKDYNEAIKTDPGFALAYLGRGYTLYVMGEYDKALKDYDKTIALAPGEALAWYNRGNTWFEKEQYNKAVDDLTKSISLNPEFADAYCDRGYALFEARQYDRAIADFDKAIALKPTDSDAWYGRADVWYAKKEFAKAVEDYSRVIDLQPYEILGYNNRAYSWWALKEFDKAIDDFTISIGLDPTSAREYFNRANAKKDKLQKNSGSKKDFEMVIKDYDEAIRLNLNNSDAYSYRGQLWYTINEYSKAIKDLEMALQLNPGDKEAKSWLENAKKSQQKSELPKNDAERQAIREQAAEFIDQLRNALSLKCQNEKDIFHHGWYVEEWDEENQRPLKAGVQGWLPEIWPEIAVWDETEDFYGNPQISTFTHEGEEFWPSLVGIPIKKNLWRVIAQVRRGYMIGEKMIHEVKNFAIINRLMERIVVRIRAGQLDNEIVFGEYKLPTAYEEFETILTRMINTPYTPEKKKKK